MSEKKTSKEGKKAKKKSSGPLKLVEKLRKAIAKDVKIPESDIEALDFSTLNELWYEADDGLHLFSKGILDKADLERGKTITLAFIQAQTSADAMGRSQTVQVAFVLKNSNEKEDFDYDSSEE